MVKEEGKFKWLEEGSGEQSIILLHGLMGGLRTLEKWLISFLKTTKFTVWT